MPEAREAAETAAAVEQGVVAATPVAVEQTAAAARPGMPEAPADLVAPAEGRLARLQPPQEAPRFSLRDRTRRRDRLPPSRNGRSIKDDKSTGGFESISSNARHPKRGPHAMFAHGTIPPESSSSLPPVTLIAAAAGNPVAAVIVRNRRHDRAIRSPRFVMTHRRWEVATLIAFSPSLIAIPRPRRAIAHPTRTGPHATIGPPVPIQSSSLLELMMIGRIAIPQAAASELAIPTPSSMRMESLLRSSAIETQ
jgi:hypothetical protein